MASGDTLLIFTPNNSEPPQSNPAQLDVRGDNHTVLDFDDTTNETTYFKSVMPQNYAGTTGVTVRLFWSHPATTGDVDWDVGFERIGDQGQDVDADGFAAVNSADTNTVPGTSGLVDVVSITFTDGADMDSVVAGDHFRLKVTRDATNDSASGDAELHLVEIQET